MRQTPELLARAKRIRLAVFDVDGVLTDGSLYLGENGNEYKAFNVRDGLGMVMLRKTGCHLAVITARSSSIVAERMQSLGINHIYQGQDDKKVAMLELVKHLDLQREQTLYLGDDLVDLPAMQQSGFPVAVADAHPLVKQASLAITDAPGGHGAAREVCEFLMHAQDTYAAQVKRILGEE